MDCGHGDGTRVCDLKEKSKAEDDQLAAATAPPQDAAQASGEAPAAESSPAAGEAPPAEAAAALPAPTPPRNSENTTLLQSAIRSAIAAKPAIPGRSPGASAEASVSLSHTTQFSHHSLYSMPQFAFCFQEAPGLVVPRRWA